MLVSGQLALLVLDIRERFLNWPDGNDAERLRIRSGVFLGAVILVYSAIQFGGLALVPGASDLVAAVQRVPGVASDTVPELSSGRLWKFALIGVVAFYFSGLLDYLFHRFVSHSRAMWFSHEYHHLPTDISVYMPGISARPFVVISTFPVLAVLVLSLQALLTASGIRGFDVITFVYVLAFLQIAIGSISHSAFLRRCWWVHRLMKHLGLTTPQEHWFHHVQELNVNFGNFTTAWDRVFGTYLDPETVDARRYRAGLDYDQDYLGALTFGKLKLPERIRSDYQLRYFCYLEGGQGTAQGDDQVKTSRAPVRPGDARGRPARLAGGAGKCPSRSGQPPP